MMLKVDTFKDAFSEDELLSLMKHSISQINSSEDIFDWKGFCKKTNIKEKDFMKIYSKLSPFYKQAADNNYSVFVSKYIFEMAEFKIIKRKILITFLTTIETIKSMKDNFNEEQKSFINLNSYFFMVESIYSAYLDLILLILILGGYNYSDKRKKNKIENISDIKKSYLATKLKFLNKIGLNVISNGCNRNLRNAIAHCDFIIDEDGDIFIEKQKKNTIDIKKEINKLKLVILAIDGSMQKCSADRFIEIIENGKELFKEIDENEDRLKLHIQDDLIE